MVLNENNIEGLKRLYNEDEAAHTILDIFASFQRNMSQTSVDRLFARLNNGGNRHKISRPQIVQTFKRLEELDCGYFISGRWNNPSRFAWTKSLISVGRAAKGEVKELEIAPENNSEDDETSDNDTVAHEYNLRPDFRVTVELPFDLTAKEATRLATFVKTLPFDTEEIE